MPAETVHPTWLHWVRTWLQPHMHMNLPPICLARSDGCCAPALGSSNGAIANIASPATAAIGRALVMALSQGHRRSQPGLQVWRHRLLGARKDQPRAAVGQQRYQRAKHHETPAEPDPLYKRVQEGVNHRHLRFGI